MFPFTKKLYLYGRYKNKLYFINSTTRKMKNVLTISFSCLALSVFGQTRDFVNTIKIENSDSQEVIIEKASHIIPTANQMRSLENEFIAFIHFGPNTFTRMEWGTGKENPEIFDLKHLDTDQWCEAIKAAGMKMVILTVKHHDGFVLWQSRYTKHGIMSTGFENGKGDILKSLSQSCKKYGLKLGVYLSPADLYQIENPEGLYGNLSKYTMRTIPRQVEGRPFANKKTFQFMLDDYNEYFMNQLFEILTEYGEIHEVWFDGAHPKRKGGQRYNYPAWKELIRELAPHASIFGREDIRWCGNESGQTRKTEWNVITYPENPDTTSHFPDITDVDLGSRNKLYQAKYLHYQQAETNTSIREGWFYRDDTEQKVRSADDVFDIYERAVGGNSTFLLNIPPNREGRFSETDVEVLKEVGKRIRETYTTDLLKRAKGPKEVLDQNKDTYKEVSASNAEIILTTPSPIKFNRLLLQEAIALRGERVEEHIVEAWLDGNWKEIAHATNIGYKRILRFPDITTTKIRIRFPKLRMNAAISKISAHYYHSRPPQLTAQRDINGKVTIEPLQPEFNWKRHGENSIDNLNAGYTIHYTLDGTTPSASSPVYKEPFLADNQELQTIAILDGKQGPVYKEQLGYIKNNWKLVAASSEDGAHKGALAFDENPATYWQSSKAEQNRSLTIDLGSVQTIRGFAYTPQKANKEGMFERGCIRISKDNEHWEKAEDFTFGNLINDPTKRYHYFKAPIKARYIQIEMTEAANKSDYASIAELDLF